MNAGQTGGAVVAGLCVAAGTVTLTNCTLTGNQDIGGSGADTTGQYAGQAGGGAIGNGGGALWPYNGRVTKNEAISRSRPPRQASSAPAVEVSMTAAKS